MTFFMNFNQGNNYPFTITKTTAALLNVDFNSKKNTEASNDYINNSSMHGRLAFEKCLEPPLSKVEDKGF